MSILYICCSCDKHYVGDALACAKSIASGTKTPCECDCHKIIGSPDGKLVDWADMAANGILSCLNTWEEEAGRLAQSAQDYHVGEAHMHQCIANKIRWIWANHSKE